MHAFTSIKELLKALYQEANLLSEMFAHRKNNAFKYDDALVLVDDQSARIEITHDHSQTQIHQGDGDNLMGGVHYYGDTQGNDSNK
jgi:ABC-type cobalamin/Fe3+-siderophores transport system ATPase subunit